MTTRETGGFNYPAERGARGDGMSPLAARWPNSLLFSPRLNRLNPSPLALEPDGHITLLHDDGHFSVPAGILQHVVHLAGVGNDVYIGNLPALFGICFTSGRGIGSGVLSKYQYVFWHGSPPMGLKQNITDL